MYLRIKSRSGIVIIACDEKLCQKIVTSGLRT